MEAHGAATASSPTAANCDAPANKIALNAAVSISERPPSRAVNPKIVPITAASTQIPIESIASRRRAARSSFTTAPLMVLESGRQPESRDRSSESTPRRRRM